MALPRTRYFLTYDLTLWTWRFTVSHTLWLFTVCKALGTVRGKTGLFRTVDLTVRLCAADIANGTVRSCAGSMTGGRLAHRQAESGTLRVVALPGALGQAVLP